MSATPATSAPSSAPPTRLVPTRCSSATASVDVTAPKVVRSTAGSLFHLPVVAGVEVEATLAALRAPRHPQLAADGSGNALLPDVDLSAPHCWVMGNEAWGLPDEVREACDEVVRVPIYGQAESLNLAMAATVCLYASAGAAGWRLAKQGS